MIDALRQSLIDNYIDGSVLFWSAGLDSTLLLAVMRDIGKPFDIFQARDLWTKEQLRRADDLIKEWDLEVYSYPSATRYFIGKDENLSVIFEYALGTQSFPHIRDVIEGNQCVAELAKIKNVFSPPIVWQNHIIGSRKDDYHWSTGSPIPSEKFEIGTNKFYAPLYNWSRLDVKNALSELGINSTEVLDEMDSGNLACCSTCLKGKGKVFCPAESREIDSVVWDKNQMTSLFQQKFNFIQQEQLYVSITNA